MNTGGATVNRGEIVSMYAGLYSHLIYPMLRHRIIGGLHVPTRNRRLLLHFQYILVFMKENLELKSHHVLSLIRMLQGHHV